MPPRTRRRGPSRMLTSGPRPGTATPAGRTTEAACARRRGPTRHRRGPLRRWRALALARGAFLAVFLRRSSSSPSSSWRWPSWPSPCGWCGLLRRGLAHGRLAGRVVAAFLAAVLRHGRLASPGGCGLLRRRLGGRSSCGPGWSRPSSPPSCGRSSCARWSSSPRSCCAGAFLAVVLRAVAFFAVVFLAAARFVVRLAGARLAVVFLAVAFFAVLVFLAGALLAVVVLRVELVAALVTLAVSSFSVAGTRASCTRTSTRWSTCSP